MKEFILTQEETERTVLVGLITNTQNEANVKKFLQRLDTPNSRTFVGSGKLSEIKAYIEENEIGMVIFDDDLSSKQVQNIERELQVKILDRTSLILDIFAKRAQTANAKRQVELAQYQYLLPRLTRLWTHLERQRGGIGLPRQDFSLERGAEKHRPTKKHPAEKPGEAGTSSISRLYQCGKIDFDEPVKQVGSLCREQTLCHARYDRAQSDCRQPSLSALRHDLLLHIVDISHPAFEEQIEVVNKTLQEVCDSTDKPMILVFNKIDAFSYVEKAADDLTPKTRENITLDEWKETWMGKMHDNCIFISAKKKKNIDELKTLLYQRVKEIHTTRFPYNDFLFQHYDEITTDEES